VDVIQVIDIDVRGTRSKWRQQNGDSRNGDT